ncbi:MAG: response regulator, partial [Proteobacteria bacterium]|nr:response regulator [Pseudomonadota bacterium]
MTEKKKPKVIVLENNDDIRQRVESILSKEGWEVTCEQTSKNALHLLGQDKQWLFALFISNFKLPKMEGDDILQTVKSISPLTQRMLLVPADKPDTLINAINKAAINACITLPFNDQDLVDQARICFKQFKHAIKRQQLKRVTGHQNKQMFKIAQNLKKKEIAYKHLIDEKKTQRVS